MSQFCGVLLKAYGEFTDRVGTLNSGAGVMSARTRTAVERMTGPFALSDLQAECPGVSLATIKRDLQAMRDEVMLMPQGRGRGARWRRLDGRRSASPG